MAIVLKNMGKMGRRVEQIENTRPTRFERPNLETRKKSESRTDIPAGIEQNGGPSSQFWSNFIKARANFAAVDFIWLFFFLFLESNIGWRDIYIFFGVGKAIVLTFSLQGMWWQVFRNIWLFIPVFMSVCLAVYLYNVCIYISSYPSFYLSTYIRVLLPYPSACLPLYVWCAYAWGLYDVCIWPTYLCMHVLCISLCIYSPTSACSCVFLFMCVFECVYV